jgi:DNA-binding Lrp family transcriptional regulator
LRAVGGELPLEEIAGALGVSVSTAWRRLRALGLAGRKRGQRADGRGRRLTIHEVQEIRAKAAAGESQAALARAKGVSRQTVHAIVRRKSWV